MKDSMLEAFVNHARPKDMQLAWIDEVCASFGSLLPIKPANATFNPYRYEREKMRQDLLRIFGINFENSPRTGQEDTKILATFNYISEICNDERIVTPDNTYAVLIAKKGDFEKSFEVATRLFDPAYDITDSFADVEEALDGVPTIVAYPLSLRLYEKAFNLHMQRANLAEATTYLKKMLEFLELYKDCDFSASFFVPKLEDLIPSLVVFLTSADRSNPEEYEAMNDIVAMVVHGGRLNLLKSLESAKLVVDCIRKTLGEKLTVGQRFKLDHVCCQIMMRNFLQSGYQNIESANNCIQDLTAYFSTYGNKKAHLEGRFFRFAERILNHRPGGKAERLKLVFAEILQNVLVNPRPLNKEGSWIRQQDDLVKPDTILHGVINDIDLFVQVIIKLHENNLRQLAPKEAEQFYLLRMQINHHLTHKIYDLPIIEKLKNENIALRADNLRLAQYCERLHSEVESLQRVQQHYLLPQAASVEAMIANLNQLRENLINNMVVQDINGTNDFAGQALDEDQEFAGDMDADVDVMMHADGNLQQQVAIPAEPETPFSPQTPTAGEEQRTSMSMR